MRLGVRIRAARQHAKLSQAALAEKLGVTRGAVANWESAEDAHPTAARLVRLATLAKVSIEWLATGRGRMTRKAIHEDTPAVDAELVYDATERRLLKAFRNNTTKIRAMILQIAETSTSTVRKTVRSTVRSKL